MIRRWADWLPRRGNSIHDLVKDRQVPRIPLHGRLFYDVGKIREGATTDDALCLVDPNNPISFTLPQHGQHGFPSSHRPLPLYKAARHIRSVKEST